MKKKNLILGICIALVSIGVCLFIAGVVCAFIGEVKISDILMGVAAALGVIGLGLLIYLLTIVASNPIEERKSQPKVVVKVVDVKDIPKSKEEKLYDQYVELHKKGLISQEDLDAKRKELLG